MSVQLSEPPQSSVLAALCRFCCPSFMFAASADISVCACRPRCVCVTSAVSLGTAVMTACHEMLRCIDILVRGISSKRKCRVRSRAERRHLHRWLTGETVDACLCALRTAVLLVAHVQHRVAGRACEFICSRRKHETMSMQNLKVCHLCLSVQTRISCD